MTGQQVKQILSENNVNLAKLASDLGISPQALNSRLKAETFKHAYLVEITQILKRDIFGISHQDYSNLLSLLVKKDEQIDRLLSIIEELTNK